MKIVILGDGLLGTELKKQSNWDLVSRKVYDDFDFNKIEECYKYLATYDVIVNCIADTNTYSQDKENHWNVNYRAVSRLVDWCNDNDKKLVHISTDFVYANSTGSPTEEDVPVHAENWYSYTKLLADGYIELKSKNYLLIRTSFKPNPFPYDMAFSDIMTNCDYVDVNAKRIIDLINENQKGIYNVGTVAQTIYDLALLTNPNVSKGNAKEGMPKDTTMDCTKFNTRKK
jgi:dTDP-4-dehydrorhamnose reductase